MRDIIYIALIIILVIISTSLSKKEVSAAKLNDHYLEVINQQERELKKYTKDVVELEKKYNEIIDKQVEILAIRKELIDYQDEKIDSMGSSMEQLNEAFLKIVNE